VRQKKKKKNQTIETNKSHLSSVPLPDLSAARTSKEEKKRNFNRRPRRNQGQGGSLVGTFLVKCEGHKKSANRGSMTWSGAGIWGESRGRGWSRNILSSVNPGCGWKAHRAIKHTEDNRDALKKEFTSSAQKKTETNKNVYRGG